MLYEHVFTGFQIHEILKLNQERIELGEETIFSDNLRGGGMWGIPPHCHDVHRLTTHFGKPYINDYWLSSAGEILLTHRREDGRGPILTVRYPLDRAWDDWVVDRVMPQLDRLTNWLQPVQS